MLHLQESIRPSADLRNHYNEISKQCRAGGEVVIITMNGRNLFQLEKQDEKPIKNHMTQFDKTHKILIIMKKLYFFVNIFIHSYPHVNEWKSL